MMIYILNYNMSQGHIPSYTIQTIFDGDLDRDWIQMFFEMNRNFQPKGILDASLLLLVTVDSTTQRPQAMLKSNHLVQKVSNIRGLVQYDQYK